MIAVHEIAKKPYGILLIYKLPSLGKSRDHTKATQGFLLSKEFMANPFILKGQQQLTFFIEKNRNR